MLHLLERLSDRMLSTVVPGIEADAATSANDGVSPQFCNCDQCTGAFYRTCCWSDCCGWSCTSCFFGC
jgi:hypothetical protein